MRFLWLPVDDVPGEGRARGYIERNAIALLSNFGKEPIDPPSPDGWAACAAASASGIRAYGTQNHVDEHYDPAFLDRLEALIAAGAGP